MRNNTKLRMYSPTMNNCFARIHRDHSCTELKIHRIQLWIYFSRKLLWNYFSTKDNVINYELVRKENSKANCMFIVNWAMLSRILVHNNCIIHAIFAVLKIMRFFWRAHIAKSGPFRIKYFPFSIHSSHAISSTTYTYGCC